MRRPARRLVGADLVAAAAKQADAIMAASAHTKELWLTQCSTSPESDRFGLVRLDSDYDWPIAFMVWYLGGAGSLPREKRR